MHDLRSMITSARCHNFSAKKKTVVFDEQFIPLELCFLFNLKFIKQGSVVLSPSEKYMYVSFELFLIYFVAYFDNKDLSPA